MRLKKWIVSLVAIILLLAGLPEYNPVLAHNDIVSLTILHTNDLHASINDFGKVAAYIKAERERNKHTLYLNAGDFFSGNPVVDLNDGKPMIELMNKLKLDAHTIGNHEFDYGQAHFAARVKESTFPWLSANTKVVDETIPIKQPEPYQIFDIDGLKVGVFSLTENPPAAAPAGKVGLKFFNYVETANQYRYLANEVDLLIGLTHIGYEADQLLAEQIDFIDLIIGGHTHTVIEEPVVIKGTPITQAGSNGNYVGHITLDYNKATGEVAVSSYLQNVKELTEVDIEVQQLVEQYKSKTDNSLNKEVAFTNTGLSRENRDKVDVSLGNFWTDAMLNRSRADVSLTNNGSIRASIDPGKITVGDFYTIEPFANEMVEIRMSGKAIKDVIDFSYQRNNKIDLQIAGLTYKVLTDENGTFINTEIYDNGQPIDLDKVYVVAVSDFLATGGDGYEFIGDVTRKKAGYITHSMLTYAGQLMNTVGAVDYKATEGRICVEVVKD